MTRRMVVATTGRADNIAEECMLAILPVCCLFFGCDLFGLPDAGYGRGIMTRRMVVATTGRADNIAEERTLAILPVCCLFFVVVISLVSHMLHGYGGGDDDGTRG